MSVIYFENIAAQMHPDGLVAIIPQWLKELSDAKSVSLALFGVAVDIVVTLASVTVDLSSFTNFSLHLIVTYVTVATVYHWREVNTCMIFGSIISCLFTHVGVKTIRQSSFIDLVYVILESTSFPQGFFPPFPFSNEKGPGNEVVLE